MADGYAEGNHAMRYRTAIALICCLLTFRASAQDAAIPCMGDDGPLLVASRAVTLRESDRETRLELQQARICFICAGVPQLHLDFRVPPKDKAAVWLQTTPRPCGSGPLCIDGASIQIDSKAIRHCTFPEGTTLDRLWTAVTDQPPPEGTHSGWHFP